MHEEKKGKRVAFNESQCQSACSGVWCLARSTLIWLPLILPLVPSVVIVRLVAHAIATSSTVSFLLISYTLEASIGICLPVDQRLKGLVAMA